MLDRIVPQVEEEVKCSLEGCDENVFRDGLCFDCFKAEQDIAHALQGYVFGDHALDGAWWGDPVEEVMA